MGNGVTCMVDGGVQQKDQRTSRGSASTERRDGRSARATPSSRLPQRGRQTLFQHLVESARHGSQDRTPTPHRRLSQRHLRGLHTATPGSASNAITTTPGMPSPPSLVETLPTRGQHLGQRQASLRKRSSSTDLTKTSARDLKKKQATPDRMRSGSSTSLSTREGRRAPGLTPSAPSGTATRSRSGTSPALRSPRNATAEDASAGLDFSYDTAADFMLASGDQTPALSTGAQEDNGSLQVSLLPDSESGGTSRGSGNTPRASGAGRASGVVDDSGSPWFFDINRMSCTPEVTPSGSVRVASPFCYRGASTTPRLYSPRLSEGRESEGTSRESDGEPTSIVKHRPSSTNSAAAAPPSVNGSPSRKNGRGSISPRGNSAVAADSRESQTPAMEDFYDLYFNNCGLSPFASPQSQMTVATTPIAASKSNSTSDDPCNSGGKVNVRGGRSKDNGKADRGRQPSPPPSSSQPQNRKAKPKSPWNASPNPAGWLEPPRDHAVATSDSSPLQRPGSSETVNTLPHHSPATKDTSASRKSTLPYNGAAPRSTAGNADKSRPSSGRLPAAAADTPTKGNRDMLESSMTQSMPDLRSSHRVDSILQSSSRFKDRRDTPDGGLLDSKAVSVSFVLAEDQAQLAILSSQRMSKATPRAAMDSPMMRYDDGTMRNARQF